MYTDVSSKSIQRPRDVVEFSSERYLEDEVLGVEMLGDECCPLGELGLLLWFNLTKLKSVNSDQRSSQVNYD